MHESIHELDIAAVQHAHSTGEFVVRHGERIKCPRRVVVVSLVINGIVPGSCAQPQPKVPVCQFKFRQGVEPVGDEAGRKIPVSIIVVR